MINYNLDYQEVSKYADQYDENREEHIDCKHDYEVGILSLKIDLGIHYKEHCDHELNVDHQV
jgi:hypothetical protein